MSAYVDHPQNPVIRRAYVMHPRPELPARLAALGLTDHADVLSEPIGVMTQPLPYEDKLESYRALVLRICKQAFMEQLYEFEPMSDELHRAALVGGAASPIEAFDRWWVAEEVDTIEIPTSW